MELADDNSKGFPWQTPAEIIEKVEQYEEHNNVTRFKVKSNEYLNSLLKSEAFGEGFFESELNIYPDIIGIDFRTEKPGCTDDLLIRVPEPIRNILSIILAPFALGFGCLLNLPSVFFGCLLAIPSLILMVIMLPFQLVIDFVDKKRLEYSLRRIQSDPKSSYAIKKIFKYSDIIPRYWQKGDVVQLIKVETRRKLKKHVLFLLAQDEPIPSKIGCAETGAFLLLGRIFNAKRRVYVIRMDKLEESDAIGERIASVLGIKINKGKFAFNRIVVEK
jgi:hypothetical protein